MTIFYLVRHGVTSHTGHRLSGRMPDIHLSDAGIAEAEVAATSLAKVRLKSIYSSPIDRCIETARTIAHKHHLVVRTRKDLTEVEYGTWTNKSLKTVARTKLWSSVQKWPSGTRFPGGESFVEIQSRGVAVLEDLRIRHPKDRICVVSHGDVIRLVLAHYLGIHLDLFQRILVTPASISVLSVTDSGPTVLTLNAPPGSPLGG
ncbi:MAG: MSMEG_4193 family putative phosphomutase [Actinomycetota bacterium]